MEAAPSPLANARPTKEKFCLQFLICARPFFLLKGKQNFSVVSCSERAGGGAGLYFCKSMAEFPPHPPSAMLLRGWTISKFTLAGISDKFKSEHRNHTKEITDEL